MSLAAYAWSLDGRNSAGADNAWVYRVTGRVDSPRWEAQAADEPAAERKFVAEPARLPELMRKSSGCPTLR